jgi:hypothetical protein
MAHLGVAIEQGGQAQIERADAYARNVYRRYIRHPVSP